MDATRTYQTHRNTLEVIKNIVSIVENRNKQLCNSFMSLITFNREDWFTRVGLVEHSVLKVQNVKLESLEAHPHALTHTQRN